MTVEEAEKQATSSPAEPVSELPPSCKLVYKMLEWNGTLTSKELATKTMLPPRTTRYATERLEDNNHITSEINFADARQHHYAITDTNE